MGEVGCSRNVRALWVSGLACQALAGRALNSYKILSRPSWYM